MGCQKIEYFRIMKYFAFIVMNRTQNIFNRVTLYNVHVCVKVPITGSSTSSPSSINSLASVTSTASTVNSQTQLCPNPEDQCLDGQTCCQISAIDYGCCPFSEAVCCQDMLHCCPHGTYCDMKTDACRVKPDPNATLYMSDLVHF